MTVETLGHFLEQLVQHNHNVELPGEIRRIVQHIGQTESLRKKPIFIERKIGKSMSVNAQLGFPLKVLEELNESLESPVKTAPKKPFFENTYHQIRQQNQMRPNRLDTGMKLPRHVEQAIENMSVSPKEVDSGVVSPLSPPSSSIDLDIAPTVHPTNMHPLSNCEDVNFQFNGTTTQLKSIRPVHHHVGTRSTAGETLTSHTSQDLIKNGRS